MKGAFKRRKFHVHAQKKRNYEHIWKNHLWTKMKLKWSASHKKTNKLRNKTKERVSIKVSIERFEHCNKSLIKLDKGRYKETLHEINENKQKRIVAEPEAFDFLLGNDAHLAIERIIKNDENNWKRCTNDEKCSRWPERKLMNV